MRFALVSVLCVGTLVAVSTSAAPSAGSAPTADLRFASLALADDFACGVALGGEAYCWGEGRDGRLGAAVKKRSPSPVAVGGGHRFRQLVVGSTRTRPGGGFACGLTPEGRALCWGSAELGQLGDGGKKSRPSPAPVAGALTFDELLAGASSVCGLERGGRVHCWGTFGQYRMAMGGGPVAFTVFSTPVAIELPESDRAARLVAGPLGVPCALAASGTAYCWELQGSSLRIGSVTPPGRAFREVAVQASFTRSCGLTTAGELLCWLYQENPNQLVLSVSPSFVGTGGVLTIDEFAPGVRFRQLVQAYDLYALAEDGSLHRVPGGVGDGQLNALAPQRPRLSPVTNVPSFRELIASPSPTGFALTEAGEAWGWGSSGSSQLGDGTKVPPVYKTEGGIAVADRYGPARATPGRVWSWLGVRTNGVCGLTADGEAWCWGSNMSGELGDGTTEDSLVPKRVGAKG